MSIEVSNTSIHLTQDGDSVGGDDIQELSIETTDAGGGHFWVISTERWAVNDLAEFADQLRKIAVAIHPDTIQNNLTEPTP